MTRRQPTLPSRTDASMAGNALTLLSASATIWLLALAGLVVWASLAQLDQVIIVRGRLVTAMPDLIIHPVARSILVTHDGKLEAEIEVDPADAGFIGRGNEVRVKLDAFPYQRHGLIDGRLRLLREDMLIRGASMGGAGTRPPTYYRGHVQLGSVQLQDLPDTVRLVPGMTVTAEILVGRRRAISCFLAPLIRVFDVSRSET